MRLWQKSRAPLDAPERPRPAGIFSGFRRFRWRLAVHEQPPAPRRGRSSGSRRPVSPPVARAGSAPAPFAARACDRGVPAYTVAPGFLAASHLPYWQRRARPDALATTARPRVRLFAGRFSGGCCMSSGRGTPRGGAQPQERWGAGGPFASRQMPRVTHREWPGRGLQLMVRCAGRRLVARGRRS